MGMAAPRYYTAEMLRQLPEDGNRYEVVHGELLVTPAPGFMHQWVVLELASRLREYTHRTGMGAVLASPADISWSPDTLVQPDLFVADLAQARARAWSAITRLLLVVEVLSPSTARADRFAKRRLYQEAGVPLYWIVDADARAAEAWTPGATSPAVERERLLWRPEGAAKPFTLALDALFRGP
jgi:Uma2 family endonuclease